MGWLSVRTPSLKLGPALRAWLSTTSTGKTTGSIRAGRLYANTRGRGTFRLSRLISWRW